MASISEIADNYEMDYGFMAVNATKQNASMLHEVHADFLLDELRQVRDELLRRGLKVVATKEEYDAGVKEHGLPPAFARKSSEA